MMTKMVNGKEVICSDKEEAQIREWWLMNDKWPEYQDARRYDGLNDPWIDMERAKEIHLELLEKYVLSEMASINDQIAIAQENGDDSTVKDLLSKRKACRELGNVDLSKANTLDDLKKMLPS